ncbi:MAG: tetratricopeptide repeat protein [Pseudomonadota bacterium]
MILRGAVSGFVAAAGLVFSPPGGAFASDGQGTAYRQCVETAWTDPDAALAEADRRIKADEGDIAARHCRAIALFELGQYGQAGPLMRSVALSLPDHRGDARAELLGQAAKAYALNGDYLTAQTNLDEAIAMAPDMPGLTPYLKVDRAHMSLALGNCAAAEADASSAIKRLPELTEAYLVRIACRRRAEDFSAARADIQRILANDPGNPDALLERGLLRLALDDISGARADWVRVVTEAPNTQASAFASRELAKLEARDQLN